ncbi:MAG: TetR/AcrR family transcriptional regulator [Lachnospiraceae bacterium]|nr:TetR/AcrR family transcriptional regulator [Lachnospiraceae bacterium]
METTIPFLQQPSTMDRRKRKTRQAIELALLELLGSKKIDEISISELAQAADVNRKTFYNHFSSVTEVLDNVEENFFHYIFSLLPEEITINNTIEIYHLLLSIIKATAPLKELLKNIFSNDHSTAFEESLSEQLLPYIRKCMTTYQVDDAVIPYLSKYIVHGVTAMYLQFIRDDSLTVEQFTMLTYNLVLSSLHLDNFRDIS